MNRNIHDDFEGTPDDLEGADVFEPSHIERRDDPRERRKQQVQDERNERLNREAAPDEDLNEGVRIVQCKDASFPGPSDRFRELCELDPLPLDEERDLLREFQESHDPLVRDRLLEHNVRVIVSVAKHCKAKPLDVLSAGLNGLLIAMEKYNPAIGGPLRDFAFLHVLGEVKKHIRTMIRSVRTPRGQTRPIDAAFNDIFLLGAVDVVDGSDIRGVETPGEAVDRGKAVLAANKASALAKKRFALAVERAQPDEVRRQRIIDLREAAGVKTWYDTYLTPKKRDIVDLSILTVDSIPLERIAEKYHCSVESVRKTEKALCAILACPPPRTRITCCVFDTWLVAERGLCVRCLADAENRVAAGATSWQALEAAGSAIPISIDDSIQLCQPPICARKVKSRGLCSLHYARAANLIRKGETSWLALEQQGKCYPVRQHLDPAVVKELVRLGTSIKAIARTLHCSPNAIRKVLQEGGTLD